tara:strand:+ start:44 stop:253 length:210 start_codon:yes stop_codon:yes gene_type:complete
MNNLNTTIDKVAMSEFGMHYYQLDDNEKQSCHDEMVNNPKWLQPEWKQPDYICQVDKWILGIEPWYKTY